MNIDYMRPLFFDNGRPVYPDIVGPRVQLDRFLRSILWGLSTDRQALRLYLWRKRIRLLSADLRAARKKARRR